MKLKLKVLRKLKITQRSLAGLLVLIFAATSIPLNVMASPGGQGVSIVAGEDNAVPPATSDTHPVTSPISYPGLSRRGLDVSLVTYEEKIGGWDLRYKNTGEDDALGLEIKTKVEGY
jgi:hypothetical protein